MGRGEKELGFLRWDGDEEELRASLLTRAIADCEAESTEDKDGSFVIVAAFKNCEEKKMVLYLQRDVDCIVDFG